MSYQGPTGSVQDPEVLRELQEISKAMAEIPTMPVRYRAPEKPRDGNFCICDGSSWNPLGDGIKRPVWFNGSIWQAF